MLTLGMADRHYASEEIIRDRVCELMVSAGASANDLATTLATLRGFGIEAISNMLLRWRSDGPDVPHCDKAILRALFERDHGRVDVWVEEDALMFYLKYGFDLYP